MVAAATVFHKEEPQSARMRLIREYYNCASDGLFTLATPVLAGLGTPTKQFSSCVLIRSDDDLDSIFASGEMMAKYAAKRAGIGLEVGRLRPLGAPIRGGEVMHTGMIPFLKKWFGDLRSCSQGGIRNASATVFYPIWHYQFDDLIVLKNNQGTEETRVRHMDYGVVLNSFFWRRFKNKENITLQTNCACTDVGCMMSHLPFPVTPPVFQAPPPLPSPASPSPSFSYLSCRSQLIEMLVKKYAYHKGIDSIMSIRISHETMKQYGGSDHVNAFVRMACLCIRVLVEQYCKDVTLASHLQARELVSLTFQRGIINKEKERELSDILTFTNIAIHSCCIVNSSVFLQKIDKALETLVML
jgi:hypothetical protein